MAHALSPGNQKTVADLSELEDSLVYKWSSRKARIVTQRNPVLGKLNSTKIKKINNGKADLNIRVKRKEVKENKTPENVQ